MGIDREIQQVHMYKSPAQPSKVEEKKKTKKIMLVSVVKFSPKSFRHSCSRGKCVLTPNQTSIFFVPHPFSTRFYSCFTEPVARDAMLMASRISEPNW